MPEPVLPFVDDEGVHLPIDLESSVALNLAGRRVWAIAPTYDGRVTDGGHRLVPWPQQLTPHLNGVADVELTMLESGERVLASQVRLGDGEGVVDPRDSEGHPLSVDKGQHLTRLFGDAGDDFKGELVDAMAEALELMRDTGHDGFLAYGNLLGAVRNGKLIGSDNDGDVAFLAKSTHPIGVMLESFALERAFVEAGWSSTRITPGVFKLNVSLGGRRTGLDVFGFFHHAGLLHMFPYLVVKVPREQILPTSTVLLEGRELAAPADPAPLLEAAYGPGWRVPDPAFRYEKPARWIRRRRQGLMLGQRRHANHWRNVYSTPRAEIPSEPTSFARWVADLPEPPTSILDVGCGAGRDSLWFAGRGMKVLGLDYTLAAVNVAAHRAKKSGAGVRFRRLNLYSLRQVLTTGALLAREEEIDAVYARYLVHALDPDGRHNLFRLARSVLSGSRGRLFLEYRTRPAEHEFGGRVDERVRPEVVADELARQGFVVEHSEDGTAPASDADGDPGVCRMIARLEG